MQARSEYKYYQIPDNCFYAVIDPDQMMPDIVRTNNSTKRKFKINFIFDKPSYYHTDINVIPWLFSYNTYNGFTPGISAWYGFLPGHGNNSAAGYIAYDFNNKEPVGSIRYIKQNNYFDLFHQQRWTLNLSKIEGHKGASIGFNWVIKKPLAKSPRSSIKTNLVKLGSTVPKIKFSYCFGTNLSMMKASILRNPVVLIFLVICNLYYPKNLPFRKPLPISPIIPNEYSLNKFLIHFLVKENSPIKYFP